MYTLLSAAKVLSLGSAWSSNSVNSTPYRQHGLVSSSSAQLGCFYDSDGVLTVFKCSIDSSTIEVAKLDEIDLPLDAHFSPSITIDAQGQTHIMGGAHVSKQFYFRNPKGTNLSSLSLIDDSLPFGDDNISYPMFLTAETGDLFLLYRIGVPGRSAWRYCQWDDKMQSWGVSSFPFVSGLGIKTWPCGPYFNSPIRDFNNQFGFFTVWRSESIAGSHQRVSNIGIDYFEANLKQHTLTAWSGATLPIPLSPAISERVIAIPWHSELTNQSGATRLPDGRPFGTAIWNTSNTAPQIHVFWPDTSGIWHSYPITDFQQDYRMMGRGTLRLPHSRPVCTTLPNGSVVIIYRSEEMEGRLIAKLLPPPEYKPSLVKTYILWDHDLGAYEPVIDVDLTWRTGKLSAYIQHCDYFKDNEASLIRKSSEAFLVTWDFSTVEEK